MKVYWLPLAMAAAGLATQPAVRAPDVPVPAAFREISSDAGTNGQSPGVTQWWKQFRDPTLDSLIERAARNNLDVLSAASRVAEARAASGVARSTLLPEVGQTTAVNRMRGGFSQGVVRVGGAPSAPQGGSFVSPFETSIVQTGFDTRWEIDLFGALRKGLSAARAEAVSAEELRRDVLLVVLADVSSNYMELRGLQQRIAIAAMNRDVQQETLELTRVRADAGLATDLDVQRQVAQLAATEAAIPALESAKTQTIHRLSVLAGEQPGALVAELEPPRALPPAPPEVPVGLPSELLKRRPDIRSAEAEIAAAAARVGAARRERFPKFVLSGLSGRQATGVSGLTLGAGNFFAIGPSLQLPLFTGGRIRSNIAVQDARLEQAQRRYEQEVLAAVEETENALAAYRRERERNASLAAAVSASRQAVTLARELYLAGLGDFLSVLEAQRSQFSAEDELERSDTALRRNVVALYKALGGGWEAGAVQ
jgi:NodT family efflux transporter outer membrane factor (OMF) lipoprotein